MCLKVQVLSLFLVVLVTMTSSVSPLSFCPFVTCPEQDCQGGKVLGQYGCCYLCAKQQGELCGGLYGLIGTCDEGLRCVLPPQEVNETVTIIHHVGVCQVKPTESADSTTLRDNGYVDIAAAAATTSAQGNQVEVATTTAGKESAPQSENPTQRNPTPAQQDKTSLRNNDLPAQPAEATARHNPTAAPGGALISNTTLSSNTAAVPQVSSFSNTSTTQDTKLENGVSSFLRTKGIDVLCLVVVLCVSSHLKGFVI